MANIKTDIKCENCFWMKRRKQPDPIPQEPQVPIALGADAKQLALYASAKYETEKRNITKL